MSTVFKWVRYAIIIPILGLLFAALSFFVFGGVDMILALIRVAAEYLGLAPVDADSIPLAIQKVEYVHQFLIGTVLIITALGFYQLFIAGLDLPQWLRVHNT